jgi:hypothetical protein
MKKFALISAILFFVVYFWANNFVPDDDPLPGGYPVMAANPVIDTESADEAVLNRILEAEAPADREISRNLIVEADAPADKGSGYYLIVASFSDIDQARQVAEKFRNDLEAEIIVLPPTPQGYYRVSYGKYSTSEEASATLPVVREKVSSDAWIYTLN